MKNVNKKEFALYIVIPIFFIEVLTLLCIYYLKTKFDIIIFILPIIYLLISYFLIVYLVEKMMISKVKLLFRTAIGRTSKYKSFFTKNNTNFLYLENELIKIDNSKQKEISRMKENEIFRREFLGNVSHELKTPLFNIQGFTEVLIDGAINDKKVNLKYLNKIDQNTTRLINIVNDLMLISQVETNELVLKLEKVDILELINTVIESLEIVAYEEKTKIQVRHNFNSPIINVIVDKQKIFQVLQNLIENAIKYTPYNSMVFINIFDIEDNYLIEIEDNGNGIKKEHLNRIFERFFRLDEDRNKKRGGTGLGLSIVKKILEAHKQTIKVKSTINKGTIFYFTLKKYKS